MTAPLLLLALGVLLLGISVTGLKATRQHTAGVFGPIPCGLPSPDCQDFCAGEAGHDGWCHDGSIEWRDDVYNIDHWASTQERTALAIKQPVTVRARLEAGTVKVARPTTNPVAKWAPIVAVTLGVVIFFISMVTDPPPRDPAPREADCAEQWITAAPGNPLCASSPDRNLTGDQLLQKYCVGTGNKMICNDKTLGVPKEMNR